MQFRHPTNDHTERAGILDAVAFLFLGPLWFLFKGMIANALAWFLLYVVVFAIAWPLFVYLNLIGAVFAPMQVRTHLLRQGYRQEVAAPVRRPDWPPAPQPQSDGMSAPGGGQALEPPVPQTGLTNRDKAQIAIGICALFGLVAWGWIASESKPALPQQEQIVGGCRTASAQVVLEQLERNTRDPVEIVARTSDLTRLVVDSTWWRDGDAGLRELVVAVVDCAVAGPGTHVASLVITARDQDVVLAQYDAVALASIRARHADRLARITPLF